MRAIFFQTVAMISSFHNLLELYKKAAGSKKKGFFPFS